MGKTQDTLGYTYEDGTNTTHNKINHDYTHTKKTTTFGGLGSTYTDDEGKVKQPKLNTQGDDDS